MVVGFAANFYLRGMNKFKSFVEWNAFGVCSAIGARMGIATSRIRQYFMYASLLTMGSPIILYMILAFWRNMRTYMKAAKRNPWYYL
jgi:phage shock protein PspC (stress-responsive transcriptional regulator)